MNYHDPNEKRSRSHEFPGIGLLEMRGGQIVLRGRNGQRDTLFPLEKAVAKYSSTMETVHAMARGGQRGWDTLMEIAQDFRARIIEAVKYRMAKNEPIPPAAAAFEQEARLSMGHNVMILNTAAPAKPTTP